MISSREDKNIWNKEFNSWYLLQLLSKILLQGNYAEQEVFEEAIIWLITLQLKNVKTEN